MSFVKKVLLIVIPGLVAYFSSLKYGFSQDDFIHLSASQVNSVTEFLNFFNPFYQYPDIFFYRPLTTHVYFYINKTIFGLNPLPFHLEGISLHLINSLLFYFLIKKLWQNEKVSLLAAIFYSLSAAHFLSLYYISAFQQIGKSFFILLSTLLFFNFQENFKKRFYFGSIMAFVLALLSKEVSIVFPFLLVLLAVLRRKEEKIITILKSLKLLLVPYFLISLVYLGYRISGFQTIFNEGNYDTNFSLTATLQNMKWFLIWSIGLPEILSTYPSLKPASLIQFSNDFLLAKLILFSLIVFIVSIILVIKNISKLTLRVSIIFVIFFFVSLSPYLFLSQHKYPHYLDLGLLVVLPLIVFLLIKSKKVWLTALGLLSFVSLQFFSLKLSEQTHWATHRAKIAANYHQSFSQQYPDIEKGSTVIFTGSKQATYELSITIAQKYALMVWYPGKIKEVWYKMPEEIFSQPPNSIVYPIIKW